MDSLGHNFAEECIALGLRTEVGISSKLFKSATGIKLKDCLDLQKVHELESQGLVSWHNDRFASSSAMPTEFVDGFVDGCGGLRATERGRSLLDLITPMILK